VTDANVVLGYLNPYYLTGGELKLNSKKARQAIEDQVARPLGMDVIEAAYGGFTIANSTMMRAIRAVSSRKGRDVRKFILFAFGGAGPVHAATIARQLEIQTVVVPPCAGVFSSLGLLFADIEYHHMETFLHRLDGSVVEDLSQALERMEDEAVRLAHRGQRDDLRITVDRYLDMRYAGQATELSIPVRGDEISPDKIPLLEERFHQEHQKTYFTSSPGEKIEVVKLRVVVKAASLARDSVNRLTRSAVSSGSSETRQVYFGKRYGWLSTPVLKEEDTGGIDGEGPLIIELYDTTVVVPRDCRVRRGALGTLIIDIKG